jgi:hypothetical protein
VTPRVIGALAQALQTKSAAQDQESAADMEELPQIEGYEDGFTFHAFKVDEPVEGPPAFAATEQEDLHKVYLFIEKSYLDPEYRELCDLLREEANVELKSSCRGASTSLRMAGRTSLSRGSYR